MCGWAGQRIIIYMCEKVTLEPTSLYAEKLIERRKKEEED